MNDKMITKEEFNKTVNSILNRIKTIETFIENHLIEADKEKRFKKRKKLIKNKFNKTVEEADEFLKSMAIEINKVNFGN